MNETNLPKRFWVEAVNTAVSILNRCPTKVLKNVTLFEAWSRIKASVSYFRIFGCICYSHIPIYKKKKLDNKSLKCIFVGCSSQTKDYLRYSIESKKLIISRNVIFKEDAVWNWNLNKEPVIPCSNKQDHFKITNSNIDETISNSNEDFEESPARKTRNPSKIYQ